MLRYIVLIGFIFSGALYANMDKAVCPNQHCMAIVDAGSSGSRLHVYTYALDKTNTPIDITEIWNKKIIPGLATIEHEHRSISAYMDRLFTDAPTITMPIYFYSTAGMRLLPKANHKHVNQLVADWFDKQYYWRLLAARTITGQEEGVYAWLSMNYQLKRLDQNEQPLVGVMDIGGASVQIIFPINEENNNQYSPSDLITINLYGRQLPIFSHSFLGLGQNEMAHQYFDLTACYPNGFDLPSGQPGQGDARTCKLAITTLINQVHKVNKKIKPILAKTPIQQWQILGGITYLLNDPLFSFKNNVFTNKELLTQADQNICHQDWVKLEEKNPQNILLHNYCMLPSYLYALIVKGYGLHPNQPINFSALSKTTDWTLGVILQHPEI